MSENIRGVLSLRFRIAKCRKDRQVDAHEGEKGPEVKKFAGVLIGVAYVIQAKRPKVRHGSYQEDVICGSARLGAEMAEEFARQTPSRPMPKSSRAAPRPPVTPDPSAARIRITPMV